MSTELKDTTALNGEVMLTRYWGGEANGVCVQVNAMWPKAYLSLTKRQALELAVALVEFANDCREEIE